jgi:glutamate-1-semialdehyde 2,1-aminomutase
MLWYVSGALVLVFLLHAARLRLALSRAKHRSLTGHSRLARRVAALVPHYEYDQAQFFSADDAPAEVAARRRGGFEKLVALSS